MEVTALYNENDPYAARWLRNLIAAGHIAHGVVDELSIADLVPADVAGPGQRHFFAGIGVWSAALRDAGVPDDASVWTGSCPCQGLSDAGKRRGFADERHLWPEWFRLIRECRPAAIFGEQVASGLGWSWLDLVFADLEGAGYTCAAANLPAAGVGAPHRRQRILFVAYADGEQGRLLAAQRQPGRAIAQAERCGEVGELGNAGGTRGRRDTGAVSRSKTEGPGQRGSPRRLADVADVAVVAGSAGAVADPACVGRQERRSSRGRDRSGSVDDCALRGLADSAALGRREPQPALQPRSVESDPARGGNAGFVSGFWSDAEWIPCSDGVSRPVEPGTSPLVDGTRSRVVGSGATKTPSRVGQLRGYGNAIVRQVAAAFIRAALESS